MPKQYTGFHAAIQPYLRIQILCHLPLIFPSKASKKGNTTNVFSTILQLVNPHRPGDRGWTQRRSVVSKPQGREPDVRSLPTPLTIAAGSPRKLAPAITDMWKTLGYGAAP